MTRELAPKAAAALLKKSFAAKGVTLPHTEALDILARLKGFSAWSHLAKKGARTTRGDSPLKKPAPLKVLIPDGSFERWAIQQNLTDRWGELNTAYSEKKPALRDLMRQPDLLERLRSLQVFEDTFIVMKDDAYGLLFEVEYVSAESEDSSHDELGRELPSHAKVVEALRQRLLELQAEYPLVEFCIPPQEEVYSARPAVWGFASLAVAEQMTTDAREALAHELATAYRIPATQDCS